MEQTIYKKYNSEILHFPNNYLQHHSSTTIQGNQSINPSTRFCDINNNQNTILQLNYDKKFYQKNIYDNPAIFPFITNMNYFSGQPQNIKNFPFEHKPFVNNYKYVSNNHFQTPIRDEIYLNNQIHKKEKILEDIEDKNTNIMGETECQDTISNNAQYSCEEKENKSNEIFEEVNLFGELEKKK